MTRPYPYAPEHIGKRESSDGVTTMTVYLSIGNSDNKLTQQRWSEYVREMAALVDQFALQTYGWYFSLPDAPWQNAMCAVKAAVDMLPQFRGQVKTLRGLFNQDSVAWVEAPQTEFL